MAGKSIIKYDLETGDELLRGTMIAATNWGYTPATYAEGMISLLFREDGYRLSMRKRWNLYGYIRIRSADKAFLLFLILKDTFIPDSGTAK